MEIKNEMNEVLGLSELKNLIVGEDTFPVTIKNEGHEIKIIMKCLNSDDLAKINKIMLERGIDYTNIPLYNDAIRPLRLAFAIVKITIDDKKEIAIDDKLKLEEVLKSLPEHVLKALHLEYDKYNISIYDKFEKKTK